MKNACAALVVCALQNCVAWGQDSGREILQHVASAYRDVRGFQMQVTVSANKNRHGFPVAFAAPDRWSPGPHPGFPDYRKVLEGLESARSVRSKEGLEVEGKYADGLKRTFRIDPVRFVVLREENEVQGSKQTVTMSNVVWDLVPAEALFTPWAARGGRAGYVPARPVNPGGYGNCSGPEKTPEAIIAHLGGMVMLRLTIGSDGVPTDVEITESVGLGMDEEVKRCASMARYKPAEQDGVAVESHIGLGMPVGGGLRSDSDWHLARAEFFPAPGAERPIFRKADYPMRRDTHESGVVEVRAVIGADGTPRDVVGSGGGNPKIDQEGARIVAKWRFTGTGQDVPARFELRLGRVVLRLPGRP